MGDVLPTIRSLSVLNLTIPGTHDSGAFWLSHEIMPNSTTDLMEACAVFAEQHAQPLAEIFKKWAISQQSDILHQLLGGSRYFDLRVGWSQEQAAWHVYHLYVGTSVKDILQSVALFLQTYPTEVVILEISHIKDIDHAKHLPDLENLVLTTLKPYLYPSDPHFLKTIDQLIESNQRALVLMERVAFKSSSIWSRSIIHNSYAESDQIVDMQAYNLKQIQSNSAKTRLIKLSWTLTPKERTVTRGFLPREPHSLLELADKANGHLLEFYHDVRTMGLTLRHVIVVDHLETSQLLELLTELYGESHLETS
jgi:hypothetical protein